MDLLKTVIKKFSPVIVAILLGGILAAGAQAMCGWYTLSSQEEVRRMHLIDDTVFMATSGGILAVGRTDEPGLVYTNVDGLGTSDIRDIIADAAGEKWAAGFGRLIRLEDDGPRQFLFFDADDDLLALHTLADDGDFLWIGTDINLVLFSKLNDGGQIEDYYGRFGDLPDFPTVRDIALRNDSIWLATSSGLAMADRSDPLMLKSPVAWRTLGSPRLGTGMINRVALFGDDVYLATAIGVLQVNMSASDTIVTQLALGRDTLIRDLKVENDTLFFYYEGGVGFIADGSPMLLPTVGLNSYPATGLNTGNTRWIGQAEGGVYYAGTGNFTRYPYTGLPGNTITDLTVNADGIVTASFNYKPSASLIDSQWQSYNYWVRAGTTVLMSDSAGLAWAGTIGNGIWGLAAEGLINYDETNSTLRGNDDAGGESYVFVTGLANDGDYLYAGCYRALNGYPIAIGDMSNLDDPSGWDSLSLDDSKGSSFVLYLEIFDRTLAVATEFDGLYVCDMGDDPSAMDQGDCVNFTAENSFLRSNTVRVVKFSPEGILWAGTNTGLSRYDLGIERFVDVNLPAGVGRDITDLEFDGRGNLWVGTKEGLARYDASSGSFEIFTSLNSDLASDVINSLTIDRFTGNLYVGTDAGISVMPSQIGSPVFDVEQVLAFPNPFVIRSGAERLSFNYSGSATVAIYNVAGEKVIEADINTPWDGRNEGGEAVASGVYIFVIRDGDGNTGRGKVLLVRE